MKWHEFNAEVMICRSHRSGFLCCHQQVHLVHCQRLAPSHPQGNYYKKVSSRCSLRNVIALQGKGEEMPGIIVFFIFSVFVDHPELCAVFSACLVGTPLHPSNSAPTWQVALLHRRPHFSSSVPTWQVALLHREAEMQVFGKLEINAVTTL